MIVVGTLKFDYFITFERREEDGVCSSCLEDILFLEEIFFFDLLLVIFDDLKSF